MPVAQTTVTADEGAETRGELEQLVTRHMTPAGARTAGTREKLLLAERWIRGESFVYESRHGRSRPPGQRSRG